MLKKYNLYMLLLVFCFFKIFIDLKTFLSALQLKVCVSCTVFSMLNLHQSSRMACSEKGMTVTHGLNKQALLPLTSFPETSYSYVDVSMTIM